MLRRHVRLPSGLTSYVHYGLEQQSAHVYALLILSSHHPRNKWTKSPLKFEYYRTCKKSSL
jgi:hypothetical protein